MTINNKKITLIITIILILMSIFFTYRSLNTTKFYYKALLIHRAGHINLVIQNTIYAKNLPFEEKLEVIKRYAEYVESDLESGVIGSFIKVWTKKWRELLYYSNQQKLYALAYIQAALENLDLEQLDIAEEYWNKTEMVEKKRSQLKRLLECGRKYILKIKNEELDLKTVEELQNSQIDFFENN